MTKRVVLFKGQTNWLMTPEFVGDKAELSNESATRSCDKSWLAIAQRFIQVKTKEDFNDTTIWRRACITIQLANRSSKGSGIQTPQRDAG